MNILLHLPPETEARLIEQAQATGRDAETLALEAVRERFSAGEPASCPSVSTDEWLRLFDAWVGDHESRNPRLDDSRDSIYPDRW